MPDTLVERLREMNNRYIGLTTLDKELKALLTEAADALSAATERERGLLSALTDIEYDCANKADLTDAEVLECVRDTARAALAEHKGTPRG
jgi:hypothetical protein